MIILLMITISNLFSVAAQRNAARDAGHQEIKIKDGKNYTFMLFCQAFVKRQEKSVAVEQ